MPRFDFQSRGDVESITRNAGTRDRIYEHRRPMSLPHQYSLMLLSMVWILRALC
jgi:hypothetical protein